MLPQYVLDTAVDTGRAPETERATTQCVIIIGIDQYCLANLC